MLFGTLALLAQSPHGNDLKIDCGQCHNPNGWTINTETIQFDHSSTNFDLEGTHGQVDCKACHNTLIFDQAQTDCMSCHVDIHGQSVGNDCIRCHTSDNWLVFNIPEIHEQNGFPLVGPHFDVDCIQCHATATTLLFTPLPNECFQCHQDDYMAAQNPNHMASGFSTDCLECHSPLGIGWDAESINHDFFPLTMGHDIQDCSACHDTGNFSNISSDCFACHDNDYNTASNPNHVASNFPTDCVQCHSTAPGWMPAIIDHDFFPLTLGHNIQDCTACHINNNFNNTPTDCYACHQDDYNSTNNPNHQAAMFPTDCVECHTTNPGWIPANFDHDGMYFRIYSGEHEGEWNSCFDCHINPNNYSIFTCVTCHEKGETNDDHDEVPGYIYESNACLACHPNP